MALSSENTSWGKQELKPLNIFKRLKHVNLSGFVPVSITLFLSLFQDNKEFTENNNCLIILVKILFLLRLNHE